MKKQNQLIIYNTDDNKTSIALYAKDGQVWMNQKQLAELFETSKQNIGQYIAFILKESELSAGSVVKDSFTTASDVRARYLNHDLMAIFKSGSCLKSQQFEKNRIVQNKGIHIYININNFK